MITNSCDIFVVVDDCVSICCSNESKAYQPRDNSTLSLFTRKDRKFLPTWYGKYPWITLCSSQRKVYCLYCRFAHKHKLFYFSKKGEDAFATLGFDNYKKAIEKFKAHAASNSHQEAQLKWASLNQPAIKEKLSSGAARTQATRCAGLLKQMEAMRYLLRQGIALRGGTEEEGNLPQLLLCWSAENADVRSWLNEGKYMSHDIINELISLMGQAVLRKVIAELKMCQPNWFALIADEATDVNYNEQLNISVRYVTDNYSVNEVSLGLFCLPNTTAKTICMALKDVLIRCNLPLTLCRGQAYDGASAMQGKRKGVATLIKNECSAALPVHCLAHSLNLCLQDAARKVPSVRDAIDLAREIVKLIKFSPKRKHLFSEKILESDGPKGGIKPLCPTRWTVRTEAINAILMHYEVIMDTMEEVRQTTHDEYGLKATGILTSLEKFETLFSLKLGHLLFSAAEETSRVLQAKDISIQEAVSAVNLTRSFYQRQRKDENFDQFYETTVVLGAKLKIGEPVLPRYRKIPAKFGESQPYRFSSPKSMFRQQYFAACDIMIEELVDRFEQKTVMEPVLALESLLLKSANGECFDEQLKKVKESVFQSDLDFDRLQKQLGVLVDVIRQALPSVTKVTKVRTICDAMNVQDTYKEMFTETHKLLRLYLTIPITSSTSERAFSTLRRVLTYIRSSMTEK